MTRIAAMATCVVLLGGCSRDPAWKGPAAGLISTNDGSLFSIEQTDGPVLIFFYAGKLNSSTSHTSNPAIKTFDYTGTLTSEERITISYKYRSSEASRIEIGGSRFELASGTVFCIENDGQVIQLPFGGLAASREYLEKLKGYFSADKAASADG